MYDAMKSDFFKIVFPNFIIDMVHVEDLNIGSLFLLHRLVQFLLIIGNVHLRLLHEDWLRQWCISIDVDSATYRKKQTEYIYFHF